MKVLLINTIDTGGAAIAAIRLHNLLLKKGIESRMLFLRRSGRKDLDQAYYFEDIYQQFAFKALDKINTAYNRRLSFRHPSVYFNGPDSIFDLSKHPLFAWAEVVHFHWVVKFIDWQSVFAHKHKHFLWTLHDMNPFAGGEHYLTGYKDEFKWVAKRNIKKKKKSIKGSDLNIITPSHWLGELAKSSEVFNDLPVNTIRNPIDMSIFKPMDKMELKIEFGLPTDKKTILFVAENPHDERKGFALLKSALQKIDATKYHLAVIGKKDHVENEFPSATFFGSIQEEHKLAKLYNAADCFVIPSLEDNLPNTVSEALSCGTPVCGFAIGGIKEMVSNGINGFLANDFNELNTALVQTLDCAFDSVKIRAKAMDALDEQMLFDQFMKLYLSKPQN
ncbi:MAG TPA: glycosyltransferase [Bacteroidia bacterium]